MTMAKYTINSEVGVMRNIEAGNIDEAKEIYKRDNHYDFDGALAGELPVSCFWMEQDGERVKSCGCLRAELTAARGRKSTKTERNARMRAMHAAGKSVSEIAAEAGLAYQTVWTILKRA